MPEKWGHVIGYAGLYEVSNLGRIRSVDHVAAGRNKWGSYARKVKGKILTTNPNNQGYPQVTLCDGLGGRAQRTVHSVVADAFLGPKPDGKDVLHRDGDKKNCRSKNLYFGTPEQNSADAIKHGHQVRGERQGSARFTESDIRYIREKRGKMLQSALAKKFGTSRQYIGQLQRGQAWSHVQ